MKVLVIEDNSLLGKSIKRGLEEAGFIVDLACDGDEGLYYSESCAYDVMVLDWMLPKRSGIELLKHLRSIGRNIPTIMITAKGAVTDRVEGLDLGADDFLVKPFELIELIARINAVHRRSIGHGSSSVTLGGLTLDLAGQQVTFRGRRLELTGKEYDLLAALAAKRGELLKRNTLIGILYQLDSEPESNSLDVLLARVRKKLAETGVEVTTVRGKGFMLRVGEPPK